MAETVVEETPKGYELLRKLEDPVYRRTISVAKRDSMTAAEARAEFRRIGCSYDVPGKIEPSMSCDYFAEFMRRSRLTGIGDWIRRFRTGEQFHFADSGNRQILLDIMIDGPGDMDAPHLNPEDFDDFCKRRAHGHIYKRPAAPKVR